MTVDAIEAFYTSHPYPPPVTNLDRARDEWRDPQRLRAEYHLFWPHRPYRADLDILVAGCGTWQAARYALCQPDSRTIGIDVSATSVEHTLRLKRQYDLKNLEVRRLPLEQVEQLDRRFDLIVCTGVLHHLADPDAGLRALRSVLRPDGAIHLMVYARYGRIGVSMLQDYCRRLGIGTSHCEISDLAATLAALPRDHPLAQVLRGSRDALDGDALADALLNPRDRCYSVAELYELLDRHQLTLGRWLRQAPYLPQCGSIAATPHADRLAAFPPREQHAAMELWRGTMTVHSAIVFCVEARDVAPRRWAPQLDAVPLHLPWTQLIHDRLPPGAAAVLLNRSHRFTDLVLVLDAREKQLFDAIDGHRTVAAIVDRAGRAGRDRARAFFETLWRYDQIVFDASNA